MVCSHKKKHLILLIFVLPISRNKSPAKKLNEIGDSKTFKKKF